MGKRAGAADGAPNGRRRKQSSGVQRKALAFPGASPLIDARPVLVVIGNGMVSQRFCERATELGLSESHRIIVFGEEALPAYNRVELTSVLGGGAAASLILKPMLWYTERDIDLRLGERVVSIDRGRRRVVTELGDEQAYDALIFATGSYVSTPVIPGTNQHGVFTYRTLDDAQRIRERARVLARERARAVVVGSGLLGVEAGQAIAQLGCAVTLVEAAPQLLPRQLDAASAEIIADLLREAGFELCVGQSVERILVTSEMRRPLTHEAAPAGVEVHDTRLRVVLGGASPRGIDCGMVVLASGVKPRDELARASGLACPAPGGIPVDSALVTADPRVFAIGECARHAGQCPGLVAPGYAMAEVLAERIAGRPSTFAQGESCTRLEVSQQQVVVLGEGRSQEPGVQTHVLRERKSGAYRRLLVQGGRLIGATAIGDGEDLARLEDAIVTHLPLSPRDIDRLSRGIDPWQARGAALPSSYPDGAVACGCTGVTFGALRRAGDAGHRSLEQLCARTGAGSACGSCRPRLVAFAKANAITGSGRTHASLALASAAVLALVAFALYRGPLPVPQSLRAPPLLELLWTSHLARQVSGFSLAFVALVTAATLSIDRRRAARPALVTSRTVHAILGLITLGAIGVHTTLRLGHGFDRALSLSLLLMIVVGATTALSLSSERWFGSECCAKIRRFGLRLHVWLVWPAPVLLALHVLKSYYF